MVVVVREGASPQERDAIARILANGAGGYIPTPIHTSQGDVFCLPRGAATPEIEAQVRSLAGVERVVPLATSYQLASRAFQPAKTIVHVGEARIGGEEPVVIAGPCSVESEEHILEAARAARAAGAQVLRGAHSSRARRHIPSRGWDCVELSCWHRQARRRDCRLSPK